MLTSETLHKHTYLHRIPAGFKLLALALGSVVLMYLPLTALMAACAILIIIALSLGQNALLKLLRFLRAFWLIFALILALQIVVGAWFEGLVTIVRLLTMLALAHLVTLTTPMQAMMGALMPLFQPLERFGFRSKRLAIMVTLTIRFIPLLVELWTIRSEAWRARSTRRVPLRLVALLVSDALRLGDHIAEALEARGFEAHNRIK